MFSKKDIEHRQLFFINGMEHRKLHLVSFQLGIYDTEKEAYLTKIPFHKILALFVIGDATLTTPLIDRCNKNGVPLVVTKPNLRLVFSYGKMAEGNFLLRQKQYLFAKTDMSIAKVLVTSKVKNHLILLQKTRRKALPYKNAMSLFQYVLENVDRQKVLTDLLALEGKAAKTFFSTYFSDYEWKGRMQRAKPDIINTILDIGYTILFNFMECMLRLFGFDLYIGVYHRLWYERKSLVCDLVEPFRGIIDREILKSLNYKTFVIQDFEIKNNRYYLKKSENMKYYAVFVKALAKQKVEIFDFVRNYYRCFMGRKSVQEYPFYEIK